MELDVRGDQSVRWDRQLDTGEKKDVFHFKAEDIRRERTGVHAKVSLGFQRARLAMDTFNVGRDEDRRRLAKAAHGLLKNGLESAYSFERLKHDLDTFCDLLPNAWECRFDLCHYDANEPVAPLVYILRPYLLEGAGTIFFAPPKSGKSYILMTMAACIGAGLDALWRVQHRPVLYVNLERSEASMRRRWHWVCQVLGIKGIEHAVWFLHARGLPFTALAKKLDSWRVDNPNGIGLVDSISRAGYGSLKDDDVANSIVDFLNHHLRTWGAIGHTTRDSGEHVFGSIHFDAGQDIGVKVMSQRKVKERLVGVSLQITQSNDTGTPAAECLSLEFGDRDEDGLIDIRRANMAQFSGLLLAQAKSDEEKIEAHLSEFTEDSATKIAKATGVNRSNAATLLKNCDRFVFRRKEGRDAIYGLRA